MNRMDRLLAIVLELQAHRRRRAADLAATFEVSLRTIYRDILALCTAGVPIISVPGQGYSLVEGYFLPPLQLAPAEAVLILEGLRSIGRVFDPEYLTAARTAASKIATILPPALRDHVEQIQQGIHVVPTRDTATQQQHLTLLREAIHARRSVRIAYRSRTTPFSPTSATTRVVDPWILNCVKTVWYLNGYCHLRHDARNFRVERITELELLERSFELLSSPEALRNARDIPHPLPVRVLFTPEIAPWVQEELPFFVISTAMQPDGLLVTLHVRAVEDILQWVLSWGRFAQVLEPAALQTLLQQHAEAILGMYRSG